MNKLHRFLKRLCWKDAAMIMLLPFMVIPLIAAAGVLLLGGPSEAALGCFAVTGMAWLVGMSIVLIP